MIGAYAHQADLRFLLFAMTSQVCHGDTVMLSDENSLREATEAVFDPGLVQQVALRAIKMAVEIKARIAMRDAGNCSQGRHIVFAGHAKGSRGWGTRRLLDSSPEGHSHIHELKAL